MRSRKRSLEGKVVLVPVKGLYVIAVISKHMSQEGTLVAHLQRAFLETEVEFGSREIAPEDTFWCGIFWDNIKLGGCIETGITVDTSDLTEKWAAPEFGTFGFGGKHVVSTANVLLESYMGMPEFVVAPRQASVLDSAFVTGLNEAAIESFLEGKIHRHQDRQRKGARRYL